MLTTCIAFFLFTLEWFHIWGHGLILFRIRLLPRKDLVRIRYYFLVDLLSASVTSVLFVRRFQWLVAAHFLQHAYYYLYWDQTYLAKKIVTWSSLDWLQSELRTRWELDSILGTAFDIVVHLCMVYSLGPYLTTVQIIASLVIVQAGVLVLLFGPYYAWASPSSIPPWIKKRINPDKVKTQ